MKIGCMFPFCVRVHKTDATIWTECCMARRHMENVSEQGGFQHASIICKQKRVPDGGKGCQDYIPRRQ